MNRHERAKDGPADAAPLYRRVFEVLRDRILDGTYGRDAPLPSEGTIADLFDVSRITVRRALAELEKRGLVARGQGRQARVLSDIGSTVTASVAADLANTSRIGWGTEATVLGIDRVPAPDAIAEALAIPRGEPIVWINRLRSRAGLPVCFTSAYLPVDVAGRLDLERLATVPLVDLLASGGFPPTRIRQTISAAAATGAVAQHLDIEEGAPLLMIDRVVHDASDRPIEVLHARFRADAYRYHMILMEPLESPSE